MSGFIFFVQPKTQGISSWDFYVCEIQYCVPIGKIEIFLNLRSLIFYLNKGLHVAPAPFVHPRIHTYLCYYFASSMVVPSESKNAGVWWQWHKYQYHLHQNLRTACERGAWICTLPGKPQLVAFALVPLPLECAETTLKERKHLLKLWSANMMTVSFVRFLQFGVLCSAEHAVGAWRHWHQISTRSSPDSLLVY